MSDQNELGNGLSKAIDQSGCHICLAIFSPYEENIVRCTSCQLVYHEECQADEEVCIYCKQPTLDREQQSDIDLSLMPIAVQRSPPVETIASTVVVSWNDFGLAIPRSVYMMLRNLPQPYDKFLLDNLFVLPVYLIFGYLAYVVLFNTMTELSVQIQQWLLSLVG